MRFSINDVAIDYILDKEGLNEKERAEWTKRIRDDFNEEISNNKLMYLLLKRSRAELQKIAEGNYESLEYALKEDLNSVKIRLRVFAHLIDSDVMNYTHYLGLQKNEPGLIERFSHIYIVDNFIMVVFEEYDE